jgi:MFS family permease/DNA polymerase III delta prime subunit
VPQISLKENLLKLNKNYNILKEREAKYAGSTPLDLLNQIDDHERAIDLTRQAITGEISEAEWQEALSSLLLAVSNGQVVNLEAETYIAGDQVITNVYEAPPPVLPPAEAKERRELSILLDKVKTFWIEGVLEKSVHTIALIDLGKETQAEAVAHAWEQILELPDQSRQTLPPDKKISHIFDELNRALLILGAPGSGKTITLLQLARDLIAQAEQDESFSQPVPVVFNLSTWTKGQPLVDWLVEELSVKYQIPKRIGRPWLEDNRILPLLDGLDEVKDEVEAASCVEAINHFGQEYGLSGVVVCSRIEEYTRLPVRLKLNGAIRLQPLTLAQVYEYLDAAGSKLDALREALQKDKDLQELAKSPLILGIMSLAYQDVSLDIPTHQSLATTEARRQHLLDTYIERMFKRKGEQTKRYTDEQTKGWLSWLARGMEQHNQSIFLIEQLQPNWLVGQSSSWAYLLTSRIITLLLFGLITGLVFAVSYARLLRVTDTLIRGPGGWLIFGLFIGLVAGLLLALIDGIRYHRQHQNVGVETEPDRRQKVFNIVGLGLLLGVPTGLITWLFAGPWLGLGLVVATGVGAGLFFGLSEGRASLNRDILTVEALAWSWQRGLKSVLVGLGGGLILGLFFGWFFTQNQDILESYTRSYIARRLGERLFIPGVGLFYCLFGGVVGFLFGGLGSNFVETKIRPNEGIRLTLRNALLTGPGFGLMIMLAGWLIFVPLFGVQNGLDVGVGWGLLFALLAFAWYGGIDVIEHYTLRVLLWFQGHTPPHYIQFLDYAAERIFLQKVGGGYIFIHRLLLEHFAEMESHKL